MHCCHDKLIVFSWSMYVHCSNSAIDLYLWLAYLGITRPMRSVWTNMSTIQVFSFISRSFSRSQQKKNFPGKYLSWKFLSPMLPSGFTIQLQYLLTVNKDIKVWRWWFTNTCMYVFIYHILPHPPININIIPSHMIIIMLLLDQATCRWNLLH